MSTNHQPPSTAKNNSKNYPSAGLSRRHCVLKQPRENAGADAHETNTTAMQNALKTVPRNNRSTQVSITAMSPIDYHHHHRFVWLLLFCAAAAPLQGVLCLQQLLSENVGNAYSRLTTTKWRVRLDVGLQPGTWMPKRYPGWAESGARLVVDAEIEFTDDLLPANQRGEPLVGPSDRTGVVRVNHLGNTKKKKNNNNNINKGGDNSNQKPYNPSTFVSEKGTQTVTFSDGGWCIQRPTSDIRNAEGGLVQPGGILGFWLDCTSGAQRRDVEIPPNTRIFFTTGVWDDPAGLQELEKEYQLAVDDLATIEERTRETRRATMEGGATSKKNFLDQLREFRTMFVDAEAYDKLLLRKEKLERRSPPKSAAVARNGVKIAPNGSLVIKGGNPNQPGWMPTTEYLILGTFQTKALS